MKAGIITFHWATNYGAVLQTFALQEYLKSRGCDVEIINYKPRQYDFWLKYLYNPALIRFIKKDLVSHNKEKKLAAFRSRHLNLTKRYCSTSELCNSVFDYDLLISGSDQVLNPYFTIKGERKPTAAYYLPFGDCSKKIGYAVSFGCEDYSGEALCLAKDWIGNFNKVGVRESSGITILSQMQYEGNSSVVPDPTILRGKKLVEDVIGDSNEKNGKTCVYMLRSSIQLDDNSVVYIDDNHNPLSLEDWIRTISSSKFLVTNSYHGMIVAILSHTPFAVLLEKTKYSGMNDRFITLLSRLNLESRIISDINEINKISADYIDWNKTDLRLADFQEIGFDFIGI